MSPERLPGEAGVIQSVLEIEQLPIDIVADQQAAQLPPQEQTSPQPGVVERFRRKVTAIVTIGAMAIGLCSGPGPVEGEARAANTEQPLWACPFLENGLVRKM